MPVAIVCVTNDLSSDQRVHKTCLTLIDCGYTVYEYGRLLPESLPLERQYNTKRIKHCFNRSALFYAEYNIRLFFFLLFHPVDLIFSNDLDTLSAAYLVSKIKSCRLIYDTHEYYTETPELIRRPRIQKIWENIEKHIFPKIRSVITVNQSIADLYHHKYGNFVHVVRNIPSNFSVVPKTRNELGLPENKKILLIQGTGINIDRGAEEACQAMKFLDDSFVLLIIGSGDVIPVLKKMAEEENITSKIIFMPRMSFSELRQHTMQADLGLSIDKDSGLNYRFSLPNKLFDYIHAGIPVLSSGLPEIKKICDEYNIGYYIQKHESEHIAETISNIFNHQEDYKKKQKNTLIASAILNWNEEQKKLTQVIKNESL